MFADINRNAYNLKRVVGENRVHPWSMYTRELYSDFQKVFNMSTHHTGGLIIILFNANL